MKRVVVVALFLLLIGQNVWAARAKVDPIATDPYVSALLLDARTGEVLFSENPDATVYPASVVKLMNLLIVLERVEKGQNRLDEMVQVTPESAKMGGSQVYLDAKEQFSVEDLLYALMVQSANDAATALAQHIAGSKEAFVALMNTTAAELGMKNSSFHSVHGLPPSKGQEPDQTTASDLALLCRALVARPDVLRFTGTRERGFRNNSFVMRNHNHLLDDVVGCDGLKTGYYQAAGFSIAATAQQNGNRVIAIVMGSKDRKVRDAKAAELLRKGFASLPPREEVKKNVAEAAKITKTPAAQPTAQAPASAPEKSEEPSAIPVAEAESITPAPDGFRWRTFFLGMGAGILLCAPVAFFLRRKPPTTGFMR